MSRLLPRMVRLVKLGAVAGAAVGVGRLVLKRRRRSEVDESSWPTIAETAAQNSQAVDEDAADDDAAEDPADGDDAGNEAEDESQI